MIKKSESSLRLALLVGCFSVSAGTSWAANNAVGKSDQILTIFSCDGRYSKLNAVAGKTISNGFYGGYTSIQSRFDGCLIGDLLDKGSVLYALMHTSLNFSETEDRSFEIVALDPKSLSVLHRYELPAESSTPTLFYDPVQQNLLVRIKDHMALQRLSIDPNGEFVESGALVALQTPMFSTPYVDEQARIIGGDQILDSQGHLTRKIQSDSIFSSIVKEKFSSLTRVDNSSEHIYSALEEASGGGRIVYTVRGDTEPFRSPSAGIIVYDIQRGPITSFFSPFPVAQGFYGIQTLHLTPDGRRIVLEQYEWLPDKTPDVPAESAGRKHIEKTGLLAIFNADTGMLVGNITLEKAIAPQPPRAVVNFSSDSRYLYYWYGKHLYMIDVDNSRVMSKLDLPEKFDPAAVIAGR